MSLKFNKVLRPCPHNAGIQSGKDRGVLLYDYEVFLDGEHFATFARYRSEYDLRDVGGRSVLLDSRFPTPVKAKSKNNFESVFNENFCRIPTPKQVEELNKLKSQQSFIDGQKRRELKKVKHIMDCGQQTLSALKNLVRLVENDAIQCGNSEVIAAVTMANEAISEAERDTSFD